MNSWLYSKGVFLFLHYNILNSTDRQTSTMMTKTLSLDARLRIEIQLQQQSRIHSLLSSVFFSFFGRDTTLLQKSFVKSYKS